MAIYFLKEETVEKMITDISLNRERYMNDGFELGHLSNLELSFESKGRVNLDVLSSIQVPAENASFEIENSQIIYSAFEEVTRYQASDIRMWAFYCHLYATKYARARYPKKFNNEINLGDFTNSARMHFLGGSQSRELLRNNLLARLWWNYRLVKDVNEDLASDLLKVLLVNSDHRNSFVERPTQFSSNSIKAALMFSRYKYKEDVKNIYFDAPRGSKEEIKNITHYNYRSTARYLNLLGGTINLNLLSTDEIMKLIFEDEMKFQQKMTQK